MTRFSPFFLLTGGLALGLGLRANAQAGLPVVGGAPVPTLVATRALHSSQLPTEAGSRAAAVAEPGRLGRYPDGQPAGGQEAAASLSASGTGPPAASQAQVLLLLETIEAQQARLEVLQSETEAAIRRANRAEAATVAFEQRLRQLEAAGSRPGFWR